MKTKTKKQHDAEIVAEAQMLEAIRGADYFLASLFVGRGHYDKAQVNTVLQAVVAGDLLKSAHPNNTRTPIIYAVASDRVATMITYELIERMKALHNAK